LVSAIASDPTIDTLQISPSKCRLGNFNLGNLMLTAAVPRWQAAGKGAGDVL
jgi:hypothetical protein